MYVIRYVKILQQAFSLIFVIQAIQLPTELQQNAPGRHRPRT
jgi:hypothetical protein